MPKKVRARNAATAKAMRSGGQGAIADPDHGLDDDGDHRGGDAEEEGGDRRGAPYATKIADRPIKASSPGRTNKVPATSPPRRPLRSHPG